MKLNLHFRKLLWTSKTGPSSYLMGSSFMFTGRKRDSWNRKLHNLTSPKTSWLQGIMGHHLVAEADTTCTTWRETQRQPGINTHFKNQTLTASALRPQRLGNIRCLNVYLSGSLTLKRAPTGQSLYVRPKWQRQDRSTSAGVPPNGAICRAAQSLELLECVSVYVHSQSKLWTPYSLLFLYFQASETPLMSTDEVH